MYNDLFTTLATTYKADGSTAVSRELMHCTREKLIAVCSWNDRNGVYTDEDSLFEFDRIATKDELIAIITGWIAEYAY